MILVYNETKHPWIVQEFSDKGTLRIMKHNERTIDRDSVARGTTSNIFYGTIGLLAYENTVNDVTEFTNNLSLATSMNKTEIVSTKPISVTFNRKEMKPVISPDGQDRKLFLVTVPMNYRMLIAFKSRGVQLLRQSCLKGEFSCCLAITNLNKMKVTLEFVNKKNGIIDVYTFETTERDELPQIMKTTRQATVAEMESTKFTPTEFRPLRPTSLIFVKKDTIGLLPKLNREYYTIIQLTGDETQLKNSIQLARNKNYRAATFFTGRPSADIISDEETGENDKIVSLITKNFSLVNLYYSDKVVQNIKK